tara:strand:- start:7857 stop:8525 length:669 start_codon:yes stop_codon:yes gene_type:complete
MVNVEYIKNKQQQSKSFNISGIEVTIKNQTRKNVSVRKTVETLVSVVPADLLRNVNTIQVGQFSELQDRQIQAMYKNSMIFVTNEQSSNDDLLDDLIHEVAHSVEEVELEFIYGDGGIKKEFLQKRKQMWIILKNKGFDIELGHFLNDEYVEDFDMFLYKEVGYSLLSSVIANLFYSPYGATSLREYFANGFEAFFMKEDIGRLKSISPILYKKISKLSMRR